MDLFAIQSEPLPSTLSLIDIWCLRIKFPEKNYFSEEEKNKRMFLNLNLLPFAHLYFGMHRHRRITD